MWSPERWAEWRQRTVPNVLHRAAATVPHYRSLWEGSAPTSLGDWPLLHKDAVRRDSGRFVSEQARRPLFEDHTSGTSGTPLTIRLSRPTVRAWYALHEARTRRWYAVSRADRWAIIGGQLVAPPGAAEPPYWVWNAGLKQLYLSAYHLKPATVVDYMRALTEHRVSHLIGYPSAMEELARLALDAGVEGPALRVVVTNAEPLYPAQRSVISRVFGCPVRETYGMAEAVAAASECDDGRLHLWPDVGVAEVIDEAGEPVPDGEVGTLVVTGLLNIDTMLIRYVVGDRLSLEPADVRCECGRGLPLVKRVEGRADDVVRTPDGRTVGRLDPVFKADLPIRRAQIVQEELDRFTVRLVPAAGFDDRDGRTIAERLRERVGDVRVHIEVVDDIPLDANGKFRAVVSNLDVR